MSESFVPLELEVAIVQCLDAGIIHENTRDILLEKKLEARKVEKHVEDEVEERKRKIARSIHPDLIRADYEGEYSKKNIAALIANQDEILVPEIEDDAGPGAALEDDSLAIHVDRKLLLQDDEQDGAI
ncbi:hypothetical protein GUITHDRAFT_120765 [Guillardia theta CCMP2712]|uniref:Uncharacterized protein n=1 Tax=Guillardia theta (strain CCMP2712) TaxID=905079 RepID=L1IAT1_GUITC|nr:hypothetical protein GUITHDRAFT_120765 [Guillardia theta CCMP2712]EKX33029.1 hypothetical protein GUITHDRAFT_120765 [Guillardia theta CCMP2712]|eukprot:XP_005820009.1 hypothetical protein GUITHDRAFT_120765 [Guillardia theta CCMP2712]